MEESSLGTQLGRIGFSLVLLLVIFFLYIAFNFVVGMTDAAFIFPGFFRYFWSLILFFIVIGIAGFFLLIFGDFLLTGFKKSDIGGSP